MRGCVNRGLFRVGGRWARETKKQRSEKSTLFFQETIKQNIMGYRIYKHETAQQEIDDVITNQ